MPHYHWEREVLPVLGETFVIYCDRIPVAFAADGSTADRIIDALNREED